MASVDVEERFKGAWSLAGQLPTARHLAYHAKLKELRRLSLARARARPTVSGDGEWEWDLWLANELDKIYTAVSDEATKVRTGVVNVTTDVAKQVGWSVWPLAIAAVAVLWAFGGAKGTR